jgi:disulfide bond formation protein DsbB
VSASDAIDSAVGGSVRPAGPASASLWAWAALPVAAAGLAGSLCLSLGMHLKACPLCFYQRTFVMGLVGVLAMGLLSGAARPRRLGLLALPLAVAGLGVALFHVSLELRDKLECPAGMFGRGTAPQQSLALFVVLTALLAADALAGATAGAAEWVARAGAVALGVLLAVGSTVANPPPPAVPTEPYAKPPDVCRPPFRAQ